MSKRQLTKFLQDLDSTELKEQIIDLYNRFKNVKEFYDFSFNPNEDKRLKEAKYKITKEYYPDNNRRAKKRRSVAQKLIKHLQLLEVEPSKIADLMAYNIEIAQIYTEEFGLNQDSFFKSMHNSFDELLKYIDLNHLTEEFRFRIELIVVKTHSQNWYNHTAFENSKRELFDKN